MPYLPANVHQLLWSYTPTLSDRLDPTQRTSSSCTCLIWMNWVHLFDRHADVRPSTDGTYHWWDETGWHSNNFSFSSFPWHWIQMTAITVAFLATGWFTYLPPIMTGSRHSPVAPSPNLPYTHKPPPARRFSPLALDLATSVMPPPVRNRRCWRRSSPELVFSFPRKADGGRRHSIGL